jgi:hypothetical protein
LRRSAIHSRGLDGEVVGVVAQVGEVEAQLGGDAILEGSDSRRALTMATLPSWARIKDPDLRRWLQGLDADAQRRYARQPEDLLDRARGDAMAAEAVALALAPLAVPFPAGWATWTQEAQDVWWIEVFAVEVRRRHRIDLATRQGVRRSAARVILGRL